MIRSGEVNRMMAGRGVAHSERTSVATREGTIRFFDLQSLVAASEQNEDDAAFY